VKKIISAGVAALLIGTLLTACNNTSSDDCDNDSMGTGVSTMSLADGKSGGTGGGKSRSGGSRYSKPRGPVTKPRSGGHGSSHGYKPHHSSHDDDWYDCDDD
jgi:hypothetical protein